MQAFFAFARVIETAAPLTAATITVHDSGTLDLSNLFSDDGVTPLANPFTADAISGAFQFFAADGVYDITVSKVDATTYTIPVVQLNGI